MKAERKSGFVLSCNHTVLLLGPSCLGDDQWRDMQGRASLNLDKQAQQGSVWIEKNTSSTFHRFVNNQADITQIVFSLY